MARQQQRYIQLLGVAAWIVCVVLLAGCGESSMMLQRALGRDIAEVREKPEEKPCPVITTFTVAPATAKCGGQVALEIAATTLSGLPIHYAWEIEGQTFETGQKAVWNTPTTQTIGDPEKVYTVRGVASDGQCAVTQALEVTVLCVSAFDAMVHFEFGRAELDTTAQIALDEIGEKLQQNPNHAVLIEGHTDYVGTEPANERLGERRAAAVKEYLQKNWGIDPSRVLTRSFGEVQPLASNESSTGRSKNRRAEIYRVMFSTVDRPPVMP
jgi:outer membrane protein OmpA-like peptidoglycan-associated protein